MIKNIDQEPTSEFQYQETSVNFLKRIDFCKTEEELIKMYNENPSRQEQFKERFIAKRNQLLITKNQLSSNGVHH